jgi:hypothetical protein
MSIAPEALALGGEPAALRQVVGQHLAGEERGIAGLDDLAEAAAHDEGRVFRHLLGILGVPRRRRALRLQLEPVEAVGRQGEQVGQLADRREGLAAEHLDRDGALEVREVELDRLARAGEVDDAEDRLVLVGAQIGEHLAVAGTQEAQRAAAEGLGRGAHAEHPPHPVQERMRVARARLDVDRAEAVERVLDRRQDQALRVGLREAAVAVGGPLHRRAHAVAVAEEDVVAHADLVAVIDHGRAGHGEQERVHQLDPAPVALQERREAAADAEIDPRAAVGGVEVPEIVALGIGHHLERQLVVVAQEDRPLAVRRDLRRLAHDVGDREAVFLGDRHVHPRHQREVEGHVALVALAEIFLGVLRPLVRLGEQEAVGVVRVDLGADLLQDVVGLGQVLVVRALALDEVGHGVEPQPVDAEVEPVAHHLDDRLEHLGVVEVQVGLVAVEAVPEDRPAPPRPRSSSRSRCRGR